MPRGDGSGQYTRAQRFSGVQHQAYYVDTVVGAVPMERAPVYEPPNPDTDRRNSVINPTFVRLILVAGVFGLIGVLFHKFGGFSQVALRGPKRAIKPAPDVATAVQQADDTPVRDFFSAIAAMTDRRAALILLVGRALRDAAQSNGLRLTRSETARTILRRVPATWLNFPALRELVQTEELVHFGGRDLSEDAFARCLELARPLVTEAST